MVVACVYQDKEFGDCDVVVDTRARRIRARAIDGRLLCLHVCRLLKHPCSD